MVNLQIRDVDDEVRNALAREARSRGQSLSSFLRDVVEREATFARNRALVDDLAARRTGSTFTADDVVEARDAARPHG